MEGATEVAGRGAAIQGPKGRPHFCSSKGVSEVLWLAERIVRLSRFPAEDSAGIQKSSLPWAMCLGD